MVEKTFAAFFSYVHDDDTRDNGRITKLRQMLEEEVRALSGEDFEIFQDYEDIHWGQRWEERLNNALDGSTFLIAVLTPRYLRKEFCRKEVLRFLERENQLKRNDLLLSIYYIDTDLSNTSDVVASALSNHQYFDWRDLRHEPQTNPEVSKRVEKLAREIIFAMKRGGISFGPASLTVTTKGSVPFPRSNSFDTLVSNPPTKRIEPPTLIVDPMPHRGNFTRIMQAIDFAEPGSRILVHPGLYKEELVIEKPLELIGDGDRTEIIIQAQKDNILLFKTEFGRIVNLTLCQTDQHFGIEILQGRPEIEDCDITSQGLACICMDNGADPRLRRNLIHHSGQSGVLVENARGTLEDNHIWGNTNSGIQIRNGGNPTIRRNAISRNSDGIYLYNDGKGIIEDNEIWDNADGISTRAGGYPLARRNKINNNDGWAIVIDDYGGGIFEFNDLRDNKNGPWYIGKNDDEHLRFNGNVIDE